MLVGVVIVLVLKHSVRGDDVIVLRRTGRSVVDSDTPNRVVTVIVNIRRSVIVRTW